MTGGDRAALGWTPGPPGELLARSRAGGYGSLIDPVEVHIRRIGRLLVRQAVDVLAGQRLAAPVARRDEEAETRRFVLRCRGSVHERDAVGNRHVPASGAVDQVRLKLRQPLDPGEDRI